MYRLLKHAEREREETGGRDGHAEPRAPVFVSRKYFIMTQESFLCFFFFFFGILLLIFLFLRWRRLVQRCEWSRGSFLWMDGRRIVEFFQLSCSGNVRRRRRFRRDANRSSRSRRHHGLSQLSAAQLKKQNGNFVYLLFFILLFSDEIFNCVEKSTV